MTEDSFDARRSIRGHLLAGTAAVVLLVGGAGGWAATTELSGAVIAPGVLVVGSNVKKVQHPTGGVVGELRVRDGDRIKAGDVVVRLDETVTQANLTIVSKRLDELRAREARLEAERDGADVIPFAADLVARAGDVEVTRILMGERKLFESRRATRRSQEAQLKERIGQLQEQIQGFVNQIEAKRREIELIGKELVGVQDLWRQNLVQIQRVTALERDAARLEGEHGALISSMAQTKSRITETELQILQLDQDLHTEVGKELAEIRSKLAELVERKIAAEDQLKRIDIRAPQEGTVHQLSVHTVGEVLRPAETILLIVPDADVLDVEATINPRDIDQVRVGQKAVLRFSAFNQRSTPELSGVVSRISADLVSDPRTGAAYYTVRITLPPTELARLGNLRLLPGMPVEAFVRTGERTVLSYLTKPLIDQVMKAFREDH